MTRLSLLINIRVWEANSRGKFYLPKRRKDPILAFEIKYRMHDLTENLIAYDMKFEYNHIVLSHPF
jgi:hypothetical protein